MEKKIINLQKQMKEESRNIDKKRALEEIDIMVNRMLVKAMEGGAYQWIKK